jgi:hypothetical protein
MPVLFCWTGVAMESIRLQIGAFGFRKNRNPPLAYAGYGGIFVTREVVESSVESKA